LPSVFVDLGNRSGCQMKDVGQKYQSLFRFRIPVGDPSERQVAFLPGIESCEENGLIAADISVLGNRSPFDHAVFRVVFQPSHEKHFLSRPIRKQPIVRISPIDHHNRMGLKNKRFQHFHFMGFSRGHHRPLGQVPLVGKQHMQFDGAFRPAIMRPIKCGEANRDQRGIYALDGIAEAEFPFLQSGDLFALTPHMEKHISEDLPRAMFVGIRQGRSRRRFRDSEMGEFAVEGIQPVADLAERFALRELSK